MLTASNVIKTKQPIYYDTKTTNASFKKMHVILKRLGVKNNKFFLKIYDPGLIGVDPFDENLSDEMKMRVQIECTKNIYYFQRECLKIKVSGGTAPFILHRGNLAMTFCYNNRLSHYVELPRQNYKTGSALGNILHGFNFGTKNTDMMFLHQRGDGATGNLEELKGLRSELPPYLRFDTYYTAKGEPKIDNGNQSELKNRFSDNYIKCYATANSEKNADRLGRGCSQAIQFIDEFAFIPFIKTIFMASGPAYGEASLQAARNNRAYCRIIASTPGDLSDRDGSYAKKFIGNCARFYDELYDYSKEDMDRYVNENSGNDFLYIRYTYKELGRDEAYFIRQCRILDQDRDKIRREVLLEWSVGNSSSPFEPEQIEILNEKAAAVKRIESIQKYFKVKIYDDFNIFTPVLISVDVASGLGNDSSAIVVRHFFKKTVIASFKNNKIAIKKLSKLIVKLVQDLFPNAIIAIERNNVGTSLIELLLDTPVAEKLYKDYNIDETIEKYNAKGYLDQDVIKRKAYGLYTKTGNRDIMFDFLGELVSERPEVFKCVDLIEEISGLIKNNRGKILAGPGSQDDLVMAFNISEYIFRLGKNLDQYGLNRYDFLTIEDELEGDDRISNSHDIMMNELITSVNKYGGEDDIDEMTKILNFNKPKTFEDIYKEHQKQIIKDVSGSTGNTLGFNDLIDDLNNISGDNSDIYGTDDYYSDDW